MATRAVRTETHAVSIVRAVATAALFRQFVLEIRPLVTGHAIDDVVLTQQRESCLFPVIKFGVFPACCGVTVTALLAARTFVNIVWRMTGYTAVRRIFVFAAHMTGIATHLEVRIAQRKFGLVVIVLAIAPGFHTVAAIALLAQLAFVGVVFAMTADAGAIGFTVLFTVPVAGNAS